MRDDADVFAHLAMPGLVDWAAPNRASRDGTCDFLGVALRGVPVVGQLFDVVDQAEELPLPIDFASAA